MQRGKAATLTMKLIEYAQVIQYDAQNLVHIRYGELNKAMHDHIEHRQKSKTDIAEVDG